MKEMHPSGRPNREGLFCGVTAVAVVLCALLAFGLAVPLRASQPEPLPDGTPLAGYLQVDLNTAEEAALCTLPGVGQSRAQAIVEYRMQAGPFAQVEDVLQVPGMTPELLASWQGLVVVSEQKSLPQTQRKEE